jgi:intraflagellar transport protein 140
LYFFSQKGTVCVWAADNRGSLTALRQYKKKGEISCLAFCNAFTRDASIKRKTDAKTVAAPTSFFFATDKGTIVHADDLGHCADVHQLSSPVDHLLYFEEKSRLIVMTRSLLLTQYQVSDDGKVSRVMQIKLSVSGDASDKGIKSLLWAGPGLLVSAAEEKIVRFFDLASDDTYNISLTTALGGFVDRNDRISQLAFNPVDRNLAVGTQMGIVAMWKFSGLIRDLDASKGPVAGTSAGDWEVRTINSFFRCFLKISIHLHSFFFSSCSACRLGLQFCN